VFHCKRLAEAGAKLKISDIVVERAQGIAEELGGVAVEPDDVYDEPCDVFSPCAVGGVLNSETIPRLRCKGVAGAANNQLESREDGQRLHRQGILYAPDFVCNSGGAVALTGLEALGMSDDYVARKILSIRDNLRSIFEEAKQNDESPLCSTERRVQRILERGPA
jgi:glutamate dehydrogenase/leucine dehydrogenase